MERATRRMPVGPVAGTWSGQPAAEAAGLADMRRAGRTAAAAETGGLAARTRAGRLARGVRALAGDQRGQGTTEYAILVGVLVVIAILAIIAFRGKVQELWDAIANGINSL